MTAVTPTPRLHRPANWPLAPATPAEARGRQWRWLLAGAVLAFLIPFVLTDLVAINRDVYYGVFIVSVFAFVGLWLRFATESPRAVLTRNWRRGAVLGVLFISAMIGIVLRESGTSHPHGLDFAAAIAWRGVVYGLTDGLILSAFPIVSVFSAFAGRRALELRRGKAAVGALALAVSLLFTAVYHLGYSDFRGAKLRKPLAGDVIWSLPTLVTLSPLASPITHAGLHVTAVIHSYNTDTFLPPHAQAPSTGNGLLAAAPARAVEVKIFAPRTNPGSNCDRVYPLRRSVASPAVLSGAMRALLAGPTTAERRRGYGGWFSSKTAASLRGVRTVAGVAYFDFRDFRRLIPNASSSCGSALLLAQLNRTATQFRAVGRAVYSFNGSRPAFYEWLQRDVPGLGR